MITLTFCSIYGSLPVDLAMTAEEGKEALKSVLTTSKY